MRSAVGRVATHLGRLQRRLDDAGNADRDPVLKFENIFQRAVEAVCPKVRAGQGIDQLARDAHLHSRFANRTFQNIADPQLAADLLHVDRLALVRKARIAGDHKEPADAAERGDDFLDHAVDEIFLLGIAAHIGEGQHRDRRLVGERQGRRLGSPHPRAGRASLSRKRGRARVGAFRPHPIDPHRPCNVLDLLLAEILEGKG